MVGDEVGEISRTNQVWPLQAVVFYFRTMEGSE